MRSRNFTLVVGGGAAAILAAALLGYFFLFSHASDRTITPTRTATLGGVTLQLAVADTEAERQKGLGGITSLKADQGMLFVFEKDGQHSFWMKDMLIAIDILWISHDGRVVYLEKSVSPDSFPHAFTPPSVARYVLEVPAGFSEQHEIGVGSKMDL